MVLSSQLSKSYKAIYLPCERNIDAIIFVFSHTGAHFAFGKQDFRCQTIHISDQVELYFLSSAQEMLKEMRGFAESLGVKKIILLGASKAGFAALMYGGLLAEALPDVVVHILTFSPQASLYPFNAEFRFPSYRRLFERAEKDQDIDLALRTLAASPASRLVLPNTRVRVYYGERNALDTEQAGRITGQNVTRVAMPMASHFTVLPFICDTSNSDEISRMGGVITRRAEGDNDIADVLGREQADNLIAELSAVPRQPHLVDIVADFAALER